MDPEIEHTTTMTYSDTNSIHNIGMDLVCFDSKMK